jgi:hypothetical protein
MKQMRLLQIILLCLILTACEKEKNTGLSIEKISGYAQKGPFLNGTSVTISELTPALLSTGKNYPAQILDNSGTFEIKNVELASQYIELKADGFYFNEVANSNSKTQLTLYALSDLTNKSSLNVNLLTTLEKGRVEYLLSNGSNFSSAKKQAQAEILKIFEMEKSAMTESESLDISKTGDDHAILLAISVILQGYLSVADLSELLANINTDIRTDGILNSQTLGSALINNARGIKSDQIRKNLETRYETLGLAVKVPDFEKYITQFISNTKFVFTNFIGYPASGKNGLNILDKTKTEYPAGYYSLKAVLPEGSGLKVKISGTNWMFPAFQDNTGWEFTDWNDSDKSRIFSSTRIGEIDFRIRFENFGDTVSHTKTKIFVFENDATTPTWSKEITVK